MQRKKQSSRATARAKTKVKVIKFVSSNAHIDSSQRELQREIQLNEPEIMSQINDWEQMLAKTKAQVSNSLQEKNKEINLLKQELNKLKTYINAKEKFLAEQKTKETITEQELKQESARNNQLAGQINKLTELLKTKLHENEKLHEYTEQTSKTNAQLLEENQQIKLKLLQTIKELKWQKQQEPLQQEPQPQGQDKIIAYFEQLQQTEQIKDAQTKANAYRKLLLAKTKEFEQNIAEKDETITQLQNKTANQVSQKPKIKSQDAQETLTEMHDNEQIEELQQELNKYKTQLLMKIKENKQLMQQIQQIHAQVELIANKTIALEQDIATKKQQIHELAEELDFAKKKHRESEDARAQLMQQIEPLQEELKRTREGLLFRMKQEKDILQKAKHLRLANQEAEQKISWLQNTIDADKQQKEKQKQTEIFENEKINILEQANKELIKRTEALEAENKALAQEADKLQEELAKKDEYYPYAINLSKLEKEEEIKKVMKESLKRELELKLDVEKLKKIVQDQQFIIKQLKSDERETLLELHDKFKEVFTRKRGAINQAEAGILRENREKASAEKIRK